MKSWIKMRLSLTCSLAKGPSPLTVPQIAMAEARKVTAAEPEGPKRRAAQMTNGKTAYARSCAIPPDAGPLKTLNDRMTSNAANVTASMPRRKTGRLRGLVIVVEQREQERSDDEVAGRVAEPPNPPKPIIRRPGLHLREAETRDAHGRTDHGAKSRREKRQGEDILEPVKCRVEVDKAAGATRPRKALPEYFRLLMPMRGRHRCTCRRVGQEGSQRDAGPHSGAEYEDGGERDTARGPDDRHLLGNDSQRQAKLRRPEIDGGEPEDKSPAWPGTGPPDRGRARPEM